MFFTIELSLVLLLAVFIVSFLHYIYLRLFSRASLPTALLWAGVKDNGYFSRAHATLRSITETRELLEEGYYKYSKNGKSFVLPNILTGPEVILPMSDMKWLLDQPDSVLDQNEVNRQFLQADYTMLHPKVIRDTVHEAVIRQELTKQLGDFTSDIVEELDLAFKQNWGVGTDEWTEISLYATMSDVISKASNRVLVGIPLCRNQEYLQNSMKFSRGVVITAGLISMMPKVFKPIFAPVVTWYDRRFYLKCAKYITPIVRQRISAPMSDDKGKNDYVQWAIRHAAKHQDPSESSPDMISKRLAVLSFAAIQSSAITLTNLILDLASSPLSSTFLSEMRNEVSNELNAENGAWTKGSLARMVILDSALRESMRLWGFVSRGVLKMVVSPHGVTIPCGLHLPQGAKVGIAAYSIHHDEAAYPGPYQYDPFRFHRPTEDGKLKGNSLVTTSSSFMAFSHGRHACPGRFFASQQLKLALAHIALNYDIKPLPTRPANRWFVGSSGPPLDAKISVRRRANIST